MSSLRSAVALGVPTRTARRWLKRAAALGDIVEYPGRPPAETFWSPFIDDEGVEHVD